MVKLEFTPVEGCNYKHNYVHVCQDLYAHAHYNDLPAMARDLRGLCRTDLFFLLYFVLGVKTINHPWIVDRIREVEELHDRTLDLWSREHFKSLGVYENVLLSNGTEKPIGEVSVGDLLMGFNNNMVSSPVEVLAKTPEYEKETYYIELQSGKHIEVGQDHRLLTMRGFTPANEINVGDFIGVPKVLNFPILNDISSTLARWLGYMTAEGCTGGGACTFTNYDEEINDDFIRTSAELGFTTNWCGKSIYISNGSRETIRAFGLDCLAIHKGIPQAIQVAPLEAAKEFIGAFWACDGGISINSKQASCHMGSNKMVEDMQLLLLRFGITSSIHSYENGFAGHHVLSVSGKSNLNKLVRIGIKLRRKQTDLECIANKSNPGKDDPIPTGWEKLLSQGVTARVFRNAGLSYAHKSAFTSRTKVKRYAEIDCSEQLHKLCDSDIAWEKVVERRISHSKCVDIQVSGSELFICNRIITHNSTILTYGLVVQEILNDPESRIAIFSHTRGIAKAFLRRIKLTFESNDLLKLLFPDVLYSDPKNQSPKWSEDDGIIVNRKGVYNEATLEAWGLVDGMPTSRHYTIRVYDDVVTKDSVSTPEQIKKTDEAFKLSQFLGARGGTVRVIGTRYHFADQYSKMLGTGVWNERVRKGVENGVSVFLTQKELDEFKQIVCEGSSYIFNCQMLLDPVAEEAQEFKRQWLQYYRRLPERAMNLYLFCDPANEKKTRGAGSDFTVYWLWGLDPLGNFFLVDALRERLNLFERWNALKKFMSKHPTIRKVYYEQYGMQADIQHFQSKMREDGIYFHIDPIGGKLKKEDRIRKLIPLFEGGKVWLPEVMYSDSGRDLVKEFIEEEYLLFPYASHDDMLDAASRVRDDEVEAYAPMSFPVERDEDYEDNVVQMNTWGKRKANSRYANV